MTYVTVRTTAYEVSVWPADVECIDQSTWSLTVAYRGRGKWAVLRGSGSSGPCLNSDGEWDYEPLPSSRDDEWLATHRFDRDTALLLARDAAPHVRINGMTAVEALQWHTEKHGPGNSCL